MADDASLTQLIRKHPVFPAAGKYYRAWVAETRCFERNQNPEHQASALQAKSWLWSSIKRISIGIDQPYAVVEAKLKELLIPTASH